MHTLHDFLFQPVHVPTWLYWLFPWLLLGAGAAISLIFLSQGGSGVGVLGGLLLGYGVVVKLQRSNLV